MITIFRTFAETNSSVSEIKRFLIFALFGLIAALVITNCANPVSPSGGPRDEESPVVIESVPANYATFFDGNRISITFNEFVKLKNPNQQVLISPPFKNKPDYKLRGKTLILEFDEELYPQTTYTIFFGNAIVDLTEENPLTDYLFVFSTGAFIDSLELHGRVVDAFNLQPRENVFAMLFPLVSDTVPKDSIPMQLLPVHVTKANEDGIFRLYNLPEKEFLLFALEDLNNNYKFDQQAEGIAFVESSVMPGLPVALFADSLIGRDSAAVTDSLTSVSIPDSLLMEISKENFYEMFMFQQVDSTQRRLGIEAFYPPSFRLVYRMPLVDPEIKLLNDTLSSDWKVIQQGNAGDTLMVWVKIPEVDTLQMVVLDADTLRDTLLVSFTRAKEQFERSSRPRRGEEEQVRRIEMKNNLRGRTLDPGKPFKIIFNEPLIEWEFSDVFFVVGEDTMVGAPFIPDNDVHTVFRLDRPIEEDTWHEFIFPDSVFYNIYKVTNDSLKVSFTAGKSVEFGNLVFDIDLRNDTYPYVVQLLNEKEQVLREQYIETSQKVTFDLLSPGMYYVKAIQDRWRNKRWDTGIYVEKRQPEKVFYFPVQLQVRANWDLEEQWELP
jgi:hypothetical protein